MLNETMTDRRYQLSGETPFSGIVLTFALGVPASVAGGVAYAAAVCWIPFVKLLVLFTALYGVFAGAAVGWAAKRGHVRSRWAPAMLAVVCGFVGLYVAWGVTILGRGGWQSLPNPLLAFDPGVIARYMEFAFENGVWKMENDKEATKGAYLACIWLAEAVIVLGSAAGMAWTAIGKATYCETCGVWCRTEPGVRRAPEQHVAALVAALGEGNLQPLLESQQPGIGFPVYLRADLDQCPQCDDTVFLSLQHVSPWNDGKTEQTKTLVDRIAISPDDADLLRGVGGQNIVDGG